MGKRDWREEGFGEMEGSGGGGGGRRYVVDDGSGGATSTSTSSSASGKGGGGSGGGSGGASGGGTGKPMVPITRWRGSFAQRRRFFDAGEEKLDDEDISVQVDGVNELEARAGKVVVDVPSARDGGGRRNTVAVPRLGAASPSLSPGGWSANTPGTAGGSGGGNSGGGMSSGGGSTPTVEPGTGTEKHLAQLRLQREHSLDYSKKKNLGIVTDVNLTPEKIGLLYIISKYTGVRRDDGAVPQVLPGKDVTAAFQPAVATNPKQPSQVSPPESPSSSATADAAPVVVDAEAGGDVTDVSAKLMTTEKLALGRDGMGAPRDTSDAESAKESGSNGFGGEISRAKMRRHSAPAIALPPLAAGSSETDFPSMPSPSPSTSPAPVAPGLPASSLLSKWMRKSSTMVLIFEAILNGFFNYDYAPALIKVAEDLTYMNVSQEAMDDLHYLSQSGCINQLLLTTHSQQVSTAYGITSFGLELLLMKRFEYSEVIRDLDRILYCDVNGKAFSEDTLVQLDEDGLSDQYLIKTRFIASDGDFLLHNEAGYTITSLATFIEDGTCRVLTSQGQIYMCVLVCAWLSAHIECDVAVLTADVCVFSTFRRPISPSHAHTLTVTYISSPCFFECCTSATEEVSSSVGAIGTDIVSGTKTSSSAEERRRNIPDNSKQARQLIRDAKLHRRDVRSNVKGRFATKKKISLSNVLLYLAEWIPFGRNHVANVCSRLMLESKGCGGLFSSVTDRNTNDATVEHSMEAIGNCMSVVDMTEGSHINFVAEVYLPEQAGIKQVEDVGVHFHHDGSVVYGSKIDTIMGAEPTDSSLDMLTRVLVDLEQDTGFITSNLLTMYQRVMLDTLFCSSSQCRPKYRVVLADGIAANGEALNIDELMTGENHDGFKNDLRKLVGEIERIQHVPSQTASTLMVVGRVGIAILGYHGKRDSRSCPVQREIWRWLSWRGKKSAIEAFIARVYQVGDILGKLRDKLNRFEEDPKALTKIELMHSESMHELINLEEVLLHLSDSTAIGNRARRDFERVSMKAGPDQTLATEEGPPMSPMSSSSLPCADADDAEYTPDQRIANEAIVSFLGLKAMVQDVTARIRDLNIALQASRHELESLRQMTTFIQSQKSYSQTQNLIVNTKNMEDVFRSNERSSNSLEIMQIILAGSLAFDILDRLSLCYVNGFQGEYGEWFLEHFVRPPVLWVFLNLGFWAGMSMCLVYLMRALSRSFDGTVSARLVINKKMSVMHLEEMLESSEVDVLDRDVIDESQLTVENVKYKDAGWRKDLKNVKIELIFDRRNGYLLRAFISVPSANDAITTQSLKEMLLRRLQNAGVLPQPSGASLRKASMLAKTSVPDVRMPKYEHNARQLSSRFVTDTSHAQSYNRKRELYRGVKRSSSYSSYIPRSKSDDDDDTQLSSGPTRERLSLL